MTGHGGEPRRDSTEVLPVRDSRAGLPVGEAGNGASGADHVRISDRHCHGHRTTGGQPRNVAPPGIGAEIAFDLIEDASEIAELALVAVPFGLNPEPPTVAGAPRHRAPRRHMRKNDDTVARRGVLNEAGRANERLRALVTAMEKHYHRRPTKQPTRSGPSRRVNPIIPVT